MVCPSGQVRDGSASGGARPDAEQPESPQDPNVHPPLNAGVVWGPLVRPVLLFLFLSPVFDPFHSCELPADPDVRPPLKAGVVWGPLASARPSFIQVVWSVVCHCIAESLKYVAKVLMTFCCSPSTLQNGQRHDFP